MNVTIDTVAIQDAVVRAIAVYAIYNNGGWYDFGFFLGVGGFSATLLSPG